MIIKSKKIIDDFCPYCEEHRKVERIIADEPIKYKGKDMVLRDAILRKCLTCSQEYEYGGDECDAIERMYKEYERLYN